MLLLIKQRIQLFQHFFYISDNAGGNQNVLVDLRRIHINLKDLCMRRKAGGITKYPVAEACAHRHKKIAFSHAEIGILCTMHA